MAYGLPDWLTGGPSEQQPAPVREKSQDGGYIAPDRGQRELCYESRDILFGCLDKHDILDANREDEKMRKLCPDQNVAYERDCARSWIKYFKEKRVQDWKRDETIKQIQAEDKVMAAKHRARQAAKGWFS